MQARKMAVAGLAALLLAAGGAMADVLNMGGTYNPTKGTWTGLASLETVPVGNPGNAGELSGSGVGGSGLDRICGAVSYEYKIGKYEVTAGQYTEFLKKVAKTDTYGLYNTKMADPTTQYVWGCNIQRTGSSGSYDYSVDANWANRPVNWVSWGDAARFANWLHNGQPTGAQGLSTTEDGAYLLNGATTDAQLLAVSREADWKWAITSEDEWYKAAYYKGGSTNAGYWDYPTRSDTPPGRDIADVSGNNANYYSSGYLIGDPYYRTEVRAFQNSYSPYGTFDQGGNVFEWSEAISYGDLRGGSFNYECDSLLASFRGVNENRRNEYFPIGFRVSEVPEPATLSLLALGGLTMLRRRKPVTPVDRIGMGRDCIAAGRRMHSLWAATALSCVFMLPGISHAAETYWQHDPNSPGDWLDSNNWSLGAPSMPDAALIQNGGTARIMSAGATAGTMLLGYDANTEGTLVLDSNASLSAGYEYVGKFGAGLVSHKAGVNSVDRLFLGRQPSGAGTYEMTGGLLTTKDFYVGAEGSGTLSIQDPSSEIRVSNGLIFGSQGSFAAVTGSVIHMTGAWFGNASQNPGALAGLSNLRIVLEGGNEVTHVLEVGGEDHGPSLAGFEVNFAIDTLQLGGDAGIGILKLDDYGDNQPSSAGKEAIYVETLILGTNSVLDLNGFHLYTYKGQDIVLVTPGPWGEGEIVPEPATLSLLALGGLATMRRRKSA